MGAEELLPVYVKALVDYQGVLPLITDLVKLHEDCLGFLGEEMLGRRVSLPIKLPVVTDKNAYKVLRWVLPTIVDEVVRYADDIGTEVVHVPYLSNCIVQFKDASVDSLFFDISIIEIVKSMYLLAIEVDPSEKPVRRFPLAWWVIADAKAPDAYVDYFSVVYLTALFISRNPWFTDALKTAIEKAVTTYKTAIDEITKFHTALKLLTASID